jgi:hypothetical protein
MDLEYDLQLESRPALCLMAPRFLPTYWLILDTLNDPSPTLHFWIRKPEYTQCQPRLQ